MEKTLEKIAIQLEVFRPKKLLLPDIFVYSKTDLISWIDLNTKDTEEYSIFEGYVGYVSNKPIFKLKTSKYLALHHALSDSACTRNAVIACFFKGTMDDLYPALPEPFQQFADILKDWLNDFRNYLNTQVAIGFHFEPFKTRKDYALYVQDLPEREKMFRGFFFSNQEDVCDKTKDLGAVFTTWICANYEKYEDFFKSMFT
jgi:hypothetical protein